MTGTVVSTPHGPCPSQELRSPLLPKGFATLYGIAGLYEFLGAKQSGPTLIHVDNDGTICVSNNAVNHARNKHLEEQTWFLREHVDKRNVLLQYVRTVDNIADLMTKPVDIATYLHLMGLMYGANLPVTGNRRQ